jgi:DNA-binding transcriptional LysR family regulator
MDWESRIGKRIKLRDLHILQAAIEAGSMAKAASDLAITQPAVSYAISEIEHVLGVPLLDRTSQGVVPTVFGEALLERSIIVFNELRQGVSEIATLADPATGELRLGTTAPMSAIASAVFNRLVSLYPRMVFHLEVEATQLLLRDLRQRKIELAISRMTNIGVEADDLDVRTLFHDELAVICSKSNPLRGRRRVKLGDILDQPWIFPPSDAFLWPLIRAAFEEHGAEMPRPTVTTTSTYALSMLVAGGPFLAIHPRAMLSIPGEHPQLAAVDADLAVTRAPIGLITLKKRSLSPAAKVFLESAEAVVKAMGRSRSGAKRG